MSMAQPSLDAALTRLAELRRRRDCLAVERRRIVISDAPDRAGRLQYLDAERLEIEVEIRQARTVVDVLRTRRAMARAV